MQYAERDVEKLDKSGGYYMRHLMAMTDEGLHSKSAIAAELAWRDARAEELHETLQRLLDEIDDMNGWRPTALQSGGCVYDHARALLSARLVHNACGEPGLTKPGKD